MRKKSVLLLFCLSLSVFAAGCSKDSSTASNGVTQPQPDKSSTPDASNADPINPRQDQDQSPSATTQILLFNGVGTSVSDWKSLQSIITSMGLSYRLVSSAELNAMSLETMKTFGMILIPGGNSNTINAYLYKSTMIRVRQAVRDWGVNFLGICAGAFDAVGTDTWSNTTAYYGFAVAKGDWLKHWYPNGNTSLVAAVPRVSFADGTSRYLMWWDGPATPEWFGGVVARYPDGKPAISQTVTGKGFVIVSGPHPEAPPSWQYDSGTDPDGVDYDIAKKLISATLYRQPLRTF